MTQLAADQQLTLQAFQAAVDTYNQRHIALPEKIAAIAATLESHIDRLDALSESDSAFEMVYQGARSALQSQSSHRAKFLDTSAKPPTNGHAPPEVTSASHAAEPASSESNGHTAHHHPPNNAAPSPAPIKRFILATNASEPEKQYFHSYIAQLKQLNPNWNVSPDHCQAGEAEAYVMFPQDENYKLNRAAYGAAQLITQFFSPTQRP
jgi:hypothetical protein